MTKTEMASEIYSRMSRERMSAKSMRGLNHLNSSQIAKTAARNISENTTLLMPVLNIPAFKPAKCFKEEVAR
ncbi:MAG: hypothetical protein K2M27_04515 [Muribaculaceae bacterium]|nr:hypothetical protein [Muribaculaceae bacterium]